MGLSLGFLFCSIDLHFCLCASTILSRWLWLCSRAWSQAGWFLQFHSYFSRLLWLFEVFCISIPIVKLFVLALWRIMIVSWSINSRKLSLNFILSFYTPCYTTSTAKLHYITVCFHLWFSIPCLQIYWFSIKKNQTANQYLLSKWCK